MRIATGFTLLFLVALVGCAFSSENTCPNSEDIFPCICTPHHGATAVACPALEIPHPFKTLKRLLDSLLGKKDVDLELYNFELNSLPSALFNGVEIWALKFQDCSIAALSDDDQPAFSGLENSLEHLEFSNSLDDNLSTSLHHLRRLHSVKFKFDTPTTFSNAWFEGGLDTVQELLILGDGLSGFEEQSVSTLKNLQMFILSDTKLETVQRSLLPDPALKLEVLDLSDNSLTSLPEDIFSNMPALTEVNVYRNKIVRLDQTTWEPVWERLEYFDILRNPLECDSTIDWIFSLRKPGGLHGKCEGPEEYRDLHLDQLYEKKEKEQKENF